MNQQKLILTSVAIPALFTLVALFRRFIEYYSRFSKEYRFIYAYGGSVSFFVQLFLILTSLALGIYIISNRRRYTFWTIVVSLTLGLSLFIYFMTMIFF